MAAAAVLAVALAALATRGARGDVPAPQPPPHLDAVLARGVALVPGTRTGYVLDGWGGLHPFTLDGEPTPLPVSHAAYWPGWDVARAFALLPDASGGYVLDAWGGLHPFAVGAHTPPPAATVSAYWPGTDLARGLALFRDGSGGDVLDAHGGVHPFRIGLRAGLGLNPLAPRTSATWPGDVARALVLLRDGTRGFVLDREGNLHPFTSGALPLPTAQPSASWPGRDTARGLALRADDSGGWVVGADGTVHPFAVGSAAPPASPVVGFAWDGRDLARGIVVGPDGKNGYVLDGHGGLHRFLLDVPGARRLRVLAIGDSITRDVVPDLTSGFAATGRAALVDGVGVPGTGLIVNNFDWRAEATRLLAKYDPDVIVVEFAGDYFRPYLHRPDGSEIQPGDQDYFTMWSQGANALVQRLEARGATVEWIVHPHMGAAFIDRIAMTDDLIYLGLPNTWPGVRLIDELHPFSTAAGGYTDTLPIGPGGRPVRVRADDGVHLLPDGVAYYASIIVQTVLHDHALG